MHDAPRPCAGQANASLRRLRRVFGPGRSIARPCVRTRGSFRARQPAGPQGSEAQIVSAIVARAAGSRAQCRSAISTTAARCRGEVVKWIAPSSRASHSCSASSRAASTTIGVSVPRSAIRRIKATLASQFCDASSMTANACGVAVSDSRHSSAERVSINRGGCAATAEDSLVGFASELRGAAARVKANRKAAAHEPVRSQMIIVPWLVIKCVCRFDLRLGEVGNAITKARTVGEAHPTTVPRPSRPCEQRSEIPARLTHP